MSRLRCALVVPTAAAETTGAFWSAALGWPLRAGSQESGNLAHLTPPDGPPCLHLHHVDNVTGQVLLLVECPDQEQTSALHVSAGATVIKDPWGDWPWQLLRSPGGLAYSLVPPTTGIPSPVRFGDHLSRLVQVCIDCPPSLLGQELTFWQTALEGRWATSSSPGFAGKFHDDAGSPIQLLFQRLHTDDGPLRAHLDLGTDDIGADADRLEALGAVRVQDLHDGRRGWVVLQCPAGLPLCTTGNDPRSPQVRDIGA